MGEMSRMECIRYVALMIEMYVLGQGESSEEWERVKRELSGGGRTVW